MTEETNEYGTTRSVKIINTEEEKPGDVYKDTDAPSPAIKVATDAFMAHLEKVVKETMMFGSNGSPMTLDSLGTVTSATAEKKEESKPIHELLTRADFRCGNWIFMPEEGGEPPIWVDGQLHRWQDKIFVVRDLDETDLYAHKLNNIGNSDGSMYEYVKGIELRDNIMCGDFHFLKEGNDYVYYDNRGNNKFRLVRDGVEPAGNENFRSFRPTVNGHFFSVKRIKYIHEVQNFFYTVFNRDIIEQIKYD